MTRRRDPRLPPRRRALPDRRATPGSCDIRPRQASFDAGFLQESEAVGVGRWQLGLLRVVAKSGFETSYGGSDFPSDVISITLAGGMVERTRGAGRERCTTSTSTFTLLAAGSEGGFRAHGPVALVQFYIPRALKETWTEAAAELGGRRALDRDDLIFVPDERLSAALQHYVARAFDATDRPTTLEMDSRAHLIGLDLIGRHGTAVTTRGPLSHGGLACWQVRRACALMHARMDADVSLAEVAGSVGLSEAHFSRAFKRSTGEPPFRWMQRHRMERAKALLSDRRLSLAEVAQMVGFAAQPGFTTAFNRVVGTTPAAWRREFARRPR